MDGNNNDYEKLRKAFREHNLSKVQQLISTGVSLNTRSPGGNTSLHWSADNNYANGVYFCLDNNAYVDAQNNKMQTPLHCAAKKDSISVLKSLLENSANANAEDIQERTPLHLACSADAVCLLLSHGAELYSVTKYGTFPMQTANGTAQVELIKRHLALNGRPDDKFQHSETLLFSADVEAVSFLIACGANVNAKDDWGRTPLFFAVENGNSAKVKALLEHGADMYRATTTGQWTMTKAVFHTEVLQLLVKHGVDVNRWDGHGFAPLHNSVGADIKNMLILLEAGADVNANNDSSARVNIRWSPLHLAAMHINPEYTRILLEHGADPNIRNYSGESPLHAAAGRRRVDSAWELNQRGGNNGNADILRLLIAHEADVNAKSSGGWTPLHAAIGVGSLEAVQILIESGANVNALTDSKQSPLLLAKRAGHSSIEQYLTENGAVQQKASRQRTG